LQEGYAVALDEPESSLAVFDDGARAGIAGFGGASSRTALAGNGGASCIVF
jgi:hypothetical protein